MLVPAVLAAGEVAGASERETLAALVLGIEVVGRLGRAAKARRRHPGFLPTSVIGGFGATVAACRLGGFSSEATADAMGIWYAHAGGNRQALFDRTLTKRIQPGIAAQAALFAGCLAAKGFSGPRRIIGEQPASLTKLFGFDAGGTPPTVAEIMALRSTWAVEELHYKRFACCGVSDPAVAAAIALADEHHLVPEQIERIHISGPCVTSPFGAVPWGDHPTPQVLAQFCVPYAVASAIHNRCFGPAEIAPDRIAQDADLSDLARRTYLVTGKGEGGTTVRLFLQDGRELHRTQADSPRYLSPRDDVALIAKFRDNARISGLRDTTTTDRWLAAIRGFGSEAPVADFVRQWLALDAARR